MSFCISLNTKITLFFILTNLGYLFVFRHKEKRVPALKLALFHSIYNRYYLLTMSSSLIICLQPANLSITNNT